MIESADAEKYLREELNAFLSGRVRQIFESGSAPELSEAVFYSLLSPGKRIRPVLCLAFAGYDGDAKPSSENMLYSASALECIHAYSLIHDDLPAMDDDDLRRGQPTSHKKFGEWKAILAGDALNTFAFELLSHSFTGPELSQALKTFAMAAGRAGMVSGQTLDLLSEKSPDQLSPEKAKERLHAIHNQKTGALIEVSCVLGALHSGLDISKASDYGKNVGLIFQITDDLIDARGEESAGKRTGKDAEKGKLTFPGLYGIAESEKIVEKLCDESVTIADGLQIPGRHGVNYRAFLKQLPESLLSRKS